MLIFTIWLTSTHLTHHIFSLSTYDNGQAYLNVINVSAKKRRLTGRKRCKKPYDYLARMTNGGAIQVLSLRDLGVCECSPDLMVFTIISRKLAISEFTLNREEDGH